MADVHAMARKKHDAGWYPDPWNADAQRWFDGKKWTDSTQKYVFVPQMMNPQAAIPLPQSTHTLHARENITVQPMPSEPAIQLSSMVAPPAIQPSSEINSQPLNPPKATKAPKESKGSRKRALLFAFIVCVLLVGTRFAVAAILNTSVI